jgi:hypothetical protein
MKISNIRNLLLVSLALPLVMLFGCSSSEESSGSSGESSDGGHDCSMYVGKAEEECQALKDAAN